MKKPVLRSLGVRACLGYPDAIHVSCRQVFDLHDPSSWMQALSRRSWKAVFGRWIIALILGSVALGNGKLCAQVVLEFDKEEFRYADLPAGMPADLTLPFSVREPGVCIAGIAVSCGCTTATTNAACYKPGEKGELRVVLRGDKVGVQTSRIELFTEDSNLAGVVDISAEFVETLLVEPAAVDVGTVPEGSARKFTFQVTSQSDSPIKKLELKAPDGVSVTIPPLHRPEKSVRVEGSIIPGVAQVQNVMTLDAEFADGSKVTRSVPVKYDLYRELRLFPQTCFLNVPTSATTVEAKVLVCGENKVLKLLKASSNIAGGTVQVRDVAMGKEVLATFSSDAAFSTTSPTLTITGASRPYTVPITLSRLN